MDFSLSQDVKTLNEAVSARMRMAMAQYRYSQKDMAAAIGLSPHAFGSRCRAETDWKLDELLAIENATGGRITIAGLIGILPLPPYRPEATSGSSTLRMVV